MNCLGGTGLWNEADGFYYDHLMADGQSLQLQIRSIVGIIPLFAGEVLEHVKDPSSIYAKFRGALRPGGLLVVTTPALEGWLTHSRGKQLAHDHGGQKHQREGYWKAELDDLAHGANLVVTYHKYCLYTLAELFMQLTKVGYLLSRRDYEGQSDVLSLIKKPSFRVLRLVFPLVWPLVGLEGAIASGLNVHGHCHVHVAKRA